MHYLKILQILDIIESKIFEPTLSKTKSQILKPFVKIISFCYVFVQALVLKARITDI